MPRSARHWSLTTLREKLIKIGAKVVTHSRYVIFQMAEVTVPHELFAAILERIQRFGVPPPLVQRGGRGDRTTGRRFVQAESDAARKWAEIDVLEAVGAGLSRWSSRTGGFMAGSPIPAWIERPHAVE